MKGFMEGKGIEREDEERTRRNEFCAPWCGRNDASDVPDGVHTYLRGDRWFCSGFCSDAGRSLRPAPGPHPFEPPHDVPYIGSGPCWVCLQPATAPIHDQPLPDVLTKEER